MMSFSFFFTVQFCPCISCYINDGVLSSIAIELDHLFQRESSLLRNELWTYLNGIIGLMTASLVCHIRVIMFVARSWCVPSQGCTQKKYIYSSEYRYDLSCC